MLEIISNQISTEKVTLGFSNIGYIVPIPYVAGETKASSLSNASVIQLAINEGLEINYNGVSLLSYFFILGKMDSEDYFVYFHDVRAVEAYFNAIARNGFNGMAIWNVMFLIPQTFQYINTQFNILEVL